MKYLAKTNTMRVVAVTAIAVALGACSMGNMLAPAPANSSLQNASPSQDELAQSQINILPAIATECPPIKVRVGGESMARYANNSRPNPRDLNWQAVIDKQSRNCIVSNGKISVKMGVVGRVLLGPAGNVAATDVPVRFAIERDGTAVYSEKFDLPVRIDPQLQQGEFVKVVENVEIPYIGGEQITIWVGFDPRA